MADEFTKTIVVKETHLVKFRDWKELMQEHLGRRVSLGDALQACIETLYVISSEETKESERILELLEEKLRELNH